MQYVRPRGVPQQGAGSRVPKSPRLETPLSEPPAFAPPALKAVGGDLPYPPPYLAPLPPPYPAHHKDARQTFVDYLWGSRGSLPPLGLPYPLAAWPRRPLPSFPPLPLTDPRPDPAPDARPADPEAPGLRPAHLSAFTPVARASPTPTLGGDRDGGAPLPDSSRHSDDETVDIEATDDENESKTDPYKPDPYKPESFKIDAFKADSFKLETYKGDAYKPELFKPDSFKPDSYKPDTCKGGLPKHLALDFEGYKGDSHKGGEDHTVADTDGGAADAPSPSSDVRSPKDDHARKEDRLHREEHAHREELTHTPHSLARGGSPAANTSSTLNLDASRAVLEVSRRSPLLLLYFLVI